MSGTKIKIAPMTKTKVTDGSKTKATPKAKKYNRKKSTELTEPVEKTIIKIIVFKTKMPKGFSPPKLKNSLPFLRSDIAK
jgi:hypothetical protein